MEHLYGNLLVYTTSIVISKSENEAGIGLTNKINNQKDINIDWFQ